MKRDVSYRQFYAAEGVVLRLVALIINDHAECSSHMGPLQVTGMTEKGRRTPCDDNNSPLNVEKRGGEGFEPPIYRPKGTFAGLGNRCYDVKTVIEKYEFSHVSPVRWVAEQFPIDKISGS